MVGGSGPTDRHNDTLFPPIRSHLLGAGFAVLSYDKRGVGGSSGTWTAATYDDLAADAAAAARLLRDHPAVDSGAVGLFGHSEGGWVVLRAAATTDDPAFVVTNSTPGMSAARSDRWATAANLRARGADEEEIRACEALHDRIRGWARQGVAFTEIEGVLAADPAYHRILELGPALTGDLWRFLVLVYDDDPYPDLVRLRCPHLALFGGAETLVPVAESAAVFAAAACEGHDADLTLRVLPGADHRIRVGGGFAPGYLAMLTHWLAAVTATRAAGSG